MKKYITFIQKAKKRFNSTENYVEFQQFQAQWVLDNLKQDLDLKDKIVLDLGSGNGGYTKELADECKIVYSLDLNMSKKMFNKDNIAFLSGDATNIPLKGESIDFVFCSSLIEHIPLQDNVINEIYRVLKKDQFCYLSFPPFYSPVGGHQFKPFHYLGNKNAIKLAKIFNQVDAKDFETSFGNFGLYPTTIRSIKNKLKRWQFKSCKISTRFCPINFAKIIILGEFLTWHVEFLLKK